MKFDVRNRRTGEVQFTADIECLESDPLSLKLGLAVVWGKDKGADLREADLRYADLRGADLCGAVLVDADLRDTDLRGADLCGADLRGVSLCYANLRGADLRAADLQGANLRGADLQGANLRGADLRDTNLRYANLQGSDMQGANLQGVDLWGEGLKVTPVQILGYKYPIIIAGTKMQIGCERHYVSEWDAFTRRRISQMDEGAWDWRQEHKPLIMPIAQHHVAQHLELVKND